MTEQEYKEICEEVRNSGIPVPSQQKIIKACGKQVARKIIDKIIFGECPNCGNVEVSNCGCCPECGQKLKER